MSLPFKLSVRTAAILSLAGFALSGPVSVALVLYFAPQPKWISPEVFVSNFSWLQTLPYWCGFVLLSGLFLLVFAHDEQHNQLFLNDRIEIRLAKGLILLFAVLISFNYICQTSFIPHLITGDAQQNNSLLAGFSMSNPNSLSWGLEMWGYLVLACSLWLLRGVYKKKMPVLPVFLLVNVILSLVSLIWWIVDPTWIETNFGFALYLAWNAVMILILIFFWHANKAEPEE